MPTISIFYGVVIQMFWREHNSPHFPAIYAGEEVYYRHPQAGGDAGRPLAPGARHGARLGEANRDALLENWRLCQRKQPRNKIEPLA